MRDFPGRYSIFKPTPTALLAGLVFAACLFAGCADDPYTQRRIQTRSNHFNSTLSSIEKRERSCDERLKERDRQLNRWWRQNERMFQDRVMRVGDYVW